MKTPKWQSVLRWGAVLPASFVGLYGAFVGITMLMGFDWPLTRYGIKLGVPSHTSVDISKLITLLPGISIWTLTTAITVAFALRTRIRYGLLWGITSSLLLMTAYVWSRDSVSIMVSHAAALVAGIIAIGGGVLATIRRQPRLQLWTGLVAFGVLTIPVLLGGIEEPTVPHDARRVWSITLQRVDSWLYTNYPYGAIHQLVFAGDRVVTIYDSGNSGFDEKNWPLSNYKLVSIARASGEIRNTQDLKGRWGSTPPLFSTLDGHVEINTGTPQILDPDLSHANSVQPDTKIRPVLVDNINWNREYPSDKAFITLTKGNDQRLLYHGACAYNPEFLSDSTILILGCGDITLIDTSGKQIASTKVPSGSIAFAGLSRNGSRFALQFSDREGDPASALYERFVIYDSSTLRALSKIDSIELPQMQSWSALSADGRYFATGNPNLLSLYELP